jgi:hypothetical protein
MWVLTGILFAVWFVLKFGFNKGGFVHILLLTAISILGVQILAYRKTRYQKDSSER